MSRAPCHWESVVQKASRTSMVALCTPMPRRLASCWIIAPARSGASAAATSSRSGSSSAICASTSSNLASKRSILASAFGGIGSVEARSQFSQPATSTLKKRIIVVDPKRRQNSAGSVREADTIGESSSVRFADTPPSILIGFVWDRDHRTHAGSPRSQASKVRRSSSASMPSDFARRRLPVHHGTLEGWDDMDLDALRHEPPRQPEP